MAKACEHLCSGSCLLCSSVTGLIFFLGCLCENAPHLVWSEFSIRVVKWRHGKDRGNAFEDIYTVSQKEKGVCCFCLPRASLNVTQGGPPLWEQAALVLS